MKKTIAIVAGGDSSEHDVSLRSAAGIYSWIDKDKYDAYIVEISHSGWIAHLPSGKTSPVFRHNFSFKDEWLKDIKPDYAYITIHGTPGEDGVLQGYFDLLGIPYTGAGYLSSAIAMDKDLTKRLVSEYVITPQWRTVRYTEGDIARLVSETKLPCVVKPVANGSSVGVSIAHTGAELKKALEECLQFGAQVVLEQYISGREIQVGIIAGKALPSIEIIPKTGFYDYANKYQAGAAEEICPSPIPEDWEMRVRTATETVYRLIGLSVYSRADFIVTPDGTPYFLEINTLPGMTKTSLLPQEAAAVGIGYEELCEKIVEESLKQKRGL